SLACSVQCVEEPEGCGLAIADADGSNVRTFDFGAPGPWHPAPIPSNQPPPGSAGAPPGPRPEGELLALLPRGTGLGPDIAAQDPQTGDLREIVETDGIVDCQDP